MKKKNKITPIFILFLVWIASFLFPTIIQTKFITVNYEDTTAITGTVSDVIKTRGNWLIRTQDGEKYTITFILFKSDSSLEEGG